MSREPFLGRDAAAFRPAGHEQDFIAAEGVAIVQQMAREIADVLDRGVEVAEVEKLVPIARLLLHEVLAVVAVCERAVDVEYPALARFRGHDAFQFEGCPGGRFRPLAPPLNRPPGPQKTDRPTDPARGVETECAPDWRVATPKANCYAFSSMLDGSIALVCSTAR